MRPRLATLAPALVLAALATACGQSDEEQVQDVVRDFAAALRESDGKKLCEELVTQEFREQITLAEGEGAGEQCQRQVEALKSGAFEVVKVTSTKVTGDSATVNAEIEQRGQRRRQLFRLKREDGEFRLASAQ